MPVQLELPVFEVKRSEDFRAWAVVTCPREDCGETFLVKLSTWYKLRTYSRLSGQTVAIIGRSCPYCFRAARQPDRSRIR